MVRLISFCLEEKSCIHEFHIGIHERNFVQPPKKHKPTHDMALNYHSAKVNNQKISQKNAALEDNSSIF